MNTETCITFIPPQLFLELSRNKKLYVSTLLSVNLFLFFVSPKLSWGTLSNNLSNTSDNISTLPLIGLHILNAFDPFFTTKSKEMLIWEGIKELSI